MLHSRVGTVPTYEPSRNTLIQSLISNISLSLWEINTMDTPESRSLRIRPIRISVSRSVSEDVGSSMMMSFAFTESALATSTICRCAMERRLHFSRTSTSSPTSRTKRCASSMVRLWSIMKPMRPRSRPMNRFSATERLGIWLSS